MNLRTELPRIFAIALIASPAGAFAAAWTQDSGHGQVIATLTASRASQSFDGARSLNPTSRYQKFDTGMQIEYGLTDKITLMLTPGFQHVNIGTGYGSTGGNPEYIEFGARYRFAKGDNWVLSGQTTMHSAIRTNTAGPASASDTNTEIDIRTLFGYSFSFVHQPAFIDIQAGHRFRSSRSPNEIHADLTFGIKPSPRWLLVAQSFSVVSEGAGAPGFSSYDYHKFQQSIVYQITKRWAAQLGGFTTYSGRHSIQENGFIFGGWYEF